MGLRSRVPEGAWVAAFIGGLIAVAILYRVVFVRALDALVAREGWRRATPEEHEQLVKARGGGGVFDVVAGTNEGVRFLAAAREWTTGAGKGRSTHHERLAMLELSGPAPELVAERTGRLAQAVLGVVRPDLDIPEDPGFAARWRLTAEDPVDAQAVLTRPVRAALSEVGGGIRVSGSRFTWWRSGRILWPSGYRELLRDAARVRGALEDRLAEARMSPGGLPTSAPGAAPLEPATDRAAAIGVVLRGRPGARVGHLAGGAFGAGLALMGGLAAAVRGYAILDATSRGVGDDDWWRQTTTVTGVALAVAGVMLLWRTRRR